MRALVTGGAGLIGSHLCEHLAARGDEVVVLDDLSTGRRQNLSALEREGSVRFIEGSVLDPDAVARAVEGCDAVFHLAAAVGVAMVLDEPVRTLETNTVGTERVLRAASGVGARALVASSSEVYGRSAAVPYREDAELVLGPTTVARWGYACSKALDEFMALAYARERGVGVVVARLFNTVGERQVGRYGMVLPRLVARCRAGGPMEVYGDGAQTRCFAYAGDVAGVLTRLLDHPDARGRVFNVGNDEEVSVLALAEKVRDRVDPRCEIRRVPYESVYGEGFEDLRRRVPDLTRVRSLLGPLPMMGVDAIVDRVATSADGAA